MRSIYLVNVKTMRKIFSNFVCFSESLNFTKHDFWCLCSDIFLICLTFFSVAQNLTILETTRRIHWEIQKIRFSNIFIFGPTEIWNTSKKSQESPILIWPKYEQMYVLRFECATWNWNHVSFYYCYCSYLCLHYFYVM